MANRHAPNPKFHLSLAQTRELKACWQPARTLVEDRKDRLIQFKLANPSGAILTKRQLFMAAATLAGLDLPIPSWVFPLLEQEATETI